MVVARHHPVFGGHPLRCLLGVHGQRVLDRRNHEGIRSSGERYPFRRRKTNLEEALALALQFHGQHAVIELSLFVRQPYWKMQTKI